MQILIDTATDSLAELRAVHRLITEVLIAREASTDDAALTRAVVNRPGVPEVARVTGMLPTLTADFGSPAEAFGDFTQPLPFRDDSVPTGTTNVLPFPVPPIPTVAAAIPADAAAPAAADVAQPTALIVFERDSANIPWDARIHSDTRKKNQDGTWRLRRNLDAALRDAVLTELRGANPAGSDVSASAPSMSVRHDTTGTAVMVPVGQPGMVVAVPQVPPPPPSVSLPSADTSVAQAHIPAPPPVIPVPTVPAWDNSLPVPAGSLPAAVPVPPTPPLGLSDAAQPDLVPQPPTSVTAPISAPAGHTFSTLMPAISKALAGGKLTVPKVMEACASVQIANPALLHAHPEKVAQVAQLLGL